MGFDPEGTSSILAPCRRRWFQTTIATTARPKITQRVLLTQSPYYRRREGPRTSRDVQSDP